MTEHHYTVDHPPVTEEQALFLTLYHLQMAAVYYEAAPDNLELELNRFFGAGREGPPALGLPAARAWLHEMWEAYAGLDRSRPVDPS